MTERNPFGPRPQFKKRVVSTSLTADQSMALQAMKTALAIEADGAVVKAALELLWERLAAEGRVAIPASPADLLPGAEALLTFGPIEGPKP